jgi:hypothetical protein
VPKRLTTNDWRALGVYNPYQLCESGGKNVYVAYAGAQTGRAARCARWQVIRPGYCTDPKGHWLDNYNKTFVVGGRADKEAKRLEAIAWAAARYGIEGEWERDPWGSYHPPGTLEAAANKRT